MSDTAAFRRYAVSPKPRTKLKFVPALPEWQLGSTVNRLTPDERLLVRHIAHHADQIEVDGMTFLLSPVPDHLLDTLAEFEADLEDVEDDLCDEPDEGEEDDRENDNPADQEALGGRFGCVGEDYEPDSPSIRKPYREVRHKSNRKFA